MWASFKRLFTRATPAPELVTPAPLGVRQKPVPNPTALVWWLLASECERPDLPLDYPGLVQDFAPDSDDHRTWLTGTRAEFERYRQRVKARL